MADTKILSSSLSNQENQAIPQTFSSEKELADNIKGDIATFWQKGNFIEFQGAKNTRINAATFRHNNERPSSNCLIIVSGRTETYLKYKELIFDLYHQDYDIFIMDHRGQGLSERALENTNKGYVEKFQYYVDDLDYFINHFVSPSCNTKPFMLAHSMGGAIAATYLEQNPTTIQAAVLASPMLAIDSSGVPHFIAKALIAIIHFFEQLFIDGSWYFFGEHDFEEESFSSNQLMHSNARYTVFSELYINNPELQLGGVTYQWTYESLNAIDKIFSNLDKLKTPLIVLKAMQDTIIDTQGQDAFCQQLHQLNPASCPNAQPEVFEGAYHELFFESDDTRNKAINTTLNWFKQHQ